MPLPLQGGLLCRALLRFPFGSQERLCRTAFLFPERHGLWIILEVRIKRLDFRSRHAVTVRAVGNGLQFDCELDDYAAEVRKIMIVGDAPHKRAI
jgi:hypothetical protein